VNLSRLFITRPVAITLLSCGLALAGLVAYFLLPVAPMPQVDFPAIVVYANLPGASPETVATSLTTPLERRLSSIAGIDQMTSQSTEGRSQIVLIFSLSRDIHGAESDVEAAIQAARQDMPAALRSNPGYWAYNPSEAPILILALTSRTRPIGQVYDAASTIIQQKILQVPGVGNIDIGGSSLPAIRIDLNPRQLFQYGIGLEDVRAAIAASNANSPKGALSFNARRYQIYVNDTSSEVGQYRRLIIAYRNGAPVRLGDVATITNGVENVRTLGLLDGERAVLMIIRKQPDANVIQTVDRIKALLPEIRASIPSGIHLVVTHDRTGSIRTSLHDVEITLLLAVLLVVSVVLVMLRNPRAALVPAVVVPLALIGTLAVIYLLGFSLNNFSMMALTVSTGFVVDDAIVVIENITRHIEAGEPRLRAALVGASEVGFTVLAMSLALIAVFTPIILMGGLVGRIFRQFALTLAVTVALSLIISLTTTPMLCGRLLRPHPKQGRLFRAVERAFNHTREFYDHTLTLALRHPRAVMLTLLAVVGLNFYLFAIVPKSFFPQQSSGNLSGFLVAGQSSSFQAMQQKLRYVVNVIKSDPNVEHVVGFTGGGFFGGSNTAHMFITLKPLDERRLTDVQVIAELRRKLIGFTGARLYLQTASDIHSGGRQSYAEYQYTLLSDNLHVLDTWAPRIEKALKSSPLLRDVNSDQQAGGLDVQLQINRALAARYGLNLSQIDNTLYDAFGQRLVSTIYQDMNQYHVVMEVDPKFWNSPSTLKDLYVSTSGGALSGTEATMGAANNFQFAGVTRSNAAQNYALNQIATSTGGVSTGSALSTAAETMVPLANFARYGPGLTPLSVNHQGPFVATTFSFNLPVGEPLGVATAAIERTLRDLDVPVAVHGEFAGNARVFRQTVEEEPLLILAALAAVYIVLGMLYESLAQPITILSTLPSSGVGAVLALLLFGEPFSLIALIGVILLIGVVLKNAIMMVDVALVAQREAKVDAARAIHEACLLRFRPIMMTTIAAMLGALPLALMSGQGSEMRRPLGIAVVGGLAISQILTLYTTPIVYVYLDRFRRWFVRTFTRRGALALAAGRPIL
jgi:multidrug efflux pump